MAPKKRMITSKDRRTRAELADFLQGLAEKVREGSVTFTQNGSELEVPIPEVVHVDVELVDDPKRVGIKRELEIELWWKLGSDGDPAPTGGVQIA